MIVFVIDIQIPVCPKKIINSFKVRMMAKIRKRYNQVTHLTQNTTLESNINTKIITNKSQEVSTFATGDYKEAMNRRKSMINTRQNK